MYLHCIVGVLVIKDEGLLDELVVSLQLVNVGFVGDDYMFNLLQLRHLVLQGASQLQRAAANFLEDITKHQRQSTGPH